MSSISIDFVSQGWSRLRRSERQHFVSKQAFLCHLRSKVERTADGTFSYGKRLLSMFTFDRDFVYWQHINDDFLFIVFLKRKTQFRGYEQKGAERFLKYRGFLKCSSKRYGLRRKWSEFGAKWSGLPNWRTIWEFMDFVNIVCFDVLFYLTKYFNN